MEQFIARQPIFDVTRDVVGYELLFRDGLANCFNGVDGNEATRQVLLNTFVLFGLSRLTSGRPAFINFTRDFLLGDLVRLFPPHAVVVELLENIRVDREIVDACRALKDAHYTLALDDVVELESYGDLIELVDIVKVDFRSSSLDARKRVSRQLAGRPVRLLGEKVETYEELQRAIDEGFALFQGYFFSKPEVIRRRDVPGNRAQYTRMLRELRKPETDLPALEHIIKQDLALTYRLLKYVNSPLFGLRSEICSLRHALTLLGERDVRRWATLAALSAVATEKPPQLLETGLMRARFCETLASVVDPTARGIGDEMFLVGLFSVLDALLDVSLEDAVREAGVPARVKGALLGVPSPWRNLLQLALAYERGEWESVATILDALGIDLRAVAQVFIDSVDWASKASRVDVDQRWSSHAPASRSLK